MKIISLILSLMALTQPQPEPTITQQKRWATVA